MFLCYSFTNKKLPRRLLLVALLAIVCGLILRQSIVTVPAMEEEEKVVYLTFDDGPSKVTIDLLDLLKEEDVKATFFVIGATTDRGKMLYQRILDEGHTLGLHSYSHNYNQIYQSADAFFEDITRLSDHIESITGYRPEVFRFPGGSKNSVAGQGVLKEIIEGAKSRGLTYFDWNALGKDDLNYAEDPDVIAQNVIRSAGDKDTIVVLLHDNTIRTTAPEAVKKIIDYYREKGYVFKALTPDSPSVRFQ